MKTEAPRRLIGAAAGGGLGVLAYWLSLQVGYHVLVAIAVGPGIGAGLAARRCSIPWGLVIGFGSLTFTILMEWLFQPSSSRGSLVYFLTHLDTLGTKTQLSLVAALVLGVHFGMGRNPKKQGSASK